MSADAPAAGPSTPTIPWHRRLEARVLLGVTLIAGLSLASVTVVTGRVVLSHSLTRARGDLTAAQAAFTHLITTRAEFAESQTRLITALPVFRAHMADSSVFADRATMTVLADEYCHDLSAAFCVVTSGDGRWRASPGFTDSAGPVRSLDSVIQAALAGRAVRRILSLDRQLFLVVSEPGRYADEIVGTFTSAYRLDDAVARELALITRSDVALVVDGEVSGSSFYPAVREALDTMLQTDKSAFDTAGDVGLRKLGGTRYVGGMFPLGGGDGAATGKLILLEEWEPTQQFIDDIGRQLLWTGAGVFALAIGGSLILSRRMSRPLREIADVAGEIAAGQWDRRVPVRGSAEATAMAHAFNGMTGSLSHWHAEARRQTERLQAAYERYAAVTHSAHDAIVSTDDDGRVVFWNRSAESTFEYPEERAIRMPFLSLLVDDSHQAYLRLVSDVSGDTKAAVARTLECEGVRSGGATFPLELTLAAWRVGGATYLTAIIRDITERKRAQEALRQRDTQLRQAQKMEAIGRLASGVAHDFNNALSVIHGYTEQIMICAGEQHEYYADLNEVLKASQSAATLTRQLLAFSRKQALDPQVLLFSDVVGNVQKMVQRLLGDDVTLVTEFDASGGTVFADRGQLEQVIMNLCVNARDAMPTGGRVQITVRSTMLDHTASCSRLGIPSGRYVVVSVADTGHGMDAETAGHVFEPFFTTKASDKGTGLGLAIVYGIVTQSGGAIDLETAPGRGTTFTIYLPEAGETAVVEDATTTVHDMARGSETILLVEDEDSVRMILRKALDSLGYDVVEAASGEEALSLSRQCAKPIHVLLTDVMMPGMNGLALSASLSADRPDTKVVFMSGHGAEAVADQILDPVRARFLQKPFSIQVLCRELRSVVAATAA